MSYVEFPLETINTIEGDLPALDGNLTINMGNGDDSILINGFGDPLAPVVIGGNLDVNLGNGNDNFIIDTTLVNASTEIRAGKGEDTVELDGSALTGLAYINTGDTNGTDTFMADRSLFYSDTELMGGSGETQIGLPDGGMWTNLTVSTGSGNDTFSMHEFNVMGDVHVDAGSASGQSGDIIQFGDGAVGGDLVVDGRGGR